MLVCLPAAQTVWLVSCFPGQCSDFYAIEDFCTLITKPNPFLFTSALAVLLPFCHSVAATYAPYDWTSRHMGLGLWRLLSGGKASFFCAFLTLLCYL